MEHEIPSHPPARAEAEPVTQLFRPAAVEYRGRGSGGETKSLPTTPSWVRTGYWLVVISGIAVGALSLWRTLPEYVEIAPLSGDGETVDAAVYGSAFGRIEAGQGVVASLGGRQWRGVVRGMDSENRKAGGAQALAGHRDASYRLVWVTMAEAPLPRTCFEPGASEGCRMRVEVGKQSIWSAFLPVAR